MRNQATMEQKVNNADDPSLLGHCVHRIFAEAAQKHTNSKALTCGSKELSYGELDAAANRLAYGLAERGVRRGHLVAITLHRSGSLVVALLAVLKVGAAYVPIDPALPSKRIAQIMSNASPSVMLVGTGAPEAVSEWKDICLNVDELLLRNITDDGTKDTVNRDQKQGDLHSDDLACVMYTSGSTGTPKGVEMSHGSLCNMLLSLKRILRCNDTIRMLSVTTVSFDMFLVEIFLPLLCGGTVVVAQAHETRNPQAIVNLMEQYSINTLHGTPAIWDILIQWGWRGHPQLDRMLTSGEALPRQLADSLLDCGDELWNLYGPTETHVVTAWRVLPQISILVGGPLHNCHLYVLDPDKANVSVPVGSPGELFIGGAGVARGYRHNPEMTSSRFLDNPLHPGRMYRTGDVAQLLPSGEVALIGRRDDMIKLRGYRIEPGDVESSIADHELISRALVLCRDDRLVAYCTRETRLNGNHSAAKSKLSSFLRPWLAARLPQYMVPSFFVELQGFPITPNGKIDRRALPDPVVQAGSEHMMSITSGLKGELDLHRIWARVLGHDRFSVTNNFFEIGGDSRRAVMLQSELETLMGSPISPAVIYEHYTIKSMVEYLSNIKRLGDPKPTHKSRSHADNKDIAIISMACRLPNGIDTPEQFWDLLEAGSDVVADIPKDRWDAESLFSENSDTPGTSHCRRGGFIKSIDTFDSSFFGISPKEARSMDPAQCLILETCWEAFERGGYTLEQLRDSPTGVYIGTSSISAYESLNPNHTELADLDGYAVTGSASSTLSGRVSYVMGLRGPAMSIDTACSSSLVTTHAACTALRQGECDLALSAGVSLMRNPGLYVEFSRLRGMSKDGYCRPFAEDTEGTAWGEGATVVLLKRLSDAIRDNDTIHAVLRGSSVNHDGRSATLTSPSGVAQRELISTALDNAGLGPDDIDYVEAHGTGTQLGDPIEAAALAEVFRPRSGADPLWIGSVKSNVNHTQAAAGLAGLLKVVLSLRHQILPSTLHAAKPSTRIDWKSSKLALVQKKQPWLYNRGRPRRAGVSAFGIGGTNAHVIVQEPPSNINPETNTNGTTLLSRFPILLSAQTDTALLQQATNLRKYLLRSQLGEDSIKDVAFSLATSRNHFQRRLVLFATSKTELIEKLSANTLTPSATPESETHVAMLLSGQGGQWHGMGKSLSIAYPIFRESLQNVAAKFTELDPPLLDVMRAVPSGEDSIAALLQRTDYAQPALFALQVALWDLWNSWGIRPRHLLGHSVGEVAVAYIAGVLSLDDSCRLVASRSKLMQSLPSKGAMLSVETGPEHLVRAIEEFGIAGKVEIAAYNAPSQTVVSGDTHGIERLNAFCTEQGHTPKRLHVSHAFHSYHMEPMLEVLKAVAESLTYHPPRIPIVSSLTGKLAESDEFIKPSYWVKQARSPVRFSEGVKTLIGLGVNTCLELGPASAMCALANRCVTDLAMASEVVWLPSLKYEHDDLSAIQHGIGMLHMHHCSVNWRAYFNGMGCRRIELPTYPFQRERAMKHSSKQSYGIAQRNKVGRSPEETGQFRFDIEWRLLEPQPRSAGGWWGLLCTGHETDWSGETRAALERSGIQLVPVSKLEETQALDGVICLWASNADLITQVSEFASAALDQLQNATALAYSKPLVWVTLGGLGVSGRSKATAPAASTLWGLQRTAYAEHPDLELRIIDLDDACSVGELARGLTQHNEPELAVRKGQYFVPRMMPILSASVPTSAKPLIRQDGAVLITGGLGGIGRHIVRWLVDSLGMRDLVVVSRRGASSPEAEAFTSELGRFGAKVTVIAADISDRRSVASLMELFGQERPLRGIFHTAGVVDSALLSSMSPRQFSVVFKPKVNGAWYLHEQTRSMDLDCFVVLSSIASCFGFPGLANYSAANNWLNAFSTFRCSQGLPATSIVYGTWQGDGMAAQIDSATERYFAQIGLLPLSPKQGLSLLEEAIRSRRAVTIAASLELDQLRQHFGSNDHVPPVLRSLLSSSESRRDDHVSEELTLSQTLKKAPQNEHANFARRAVQDAVAKALDMSRPEQLDMDRSWRDLGVDSLTGILLRNQLARLTGLKLTPDAFSQHGSPKALSQAILSQVELPEQTHAPEERPPTMDDVVYTNGDQKLFDRSKRLITQAIQSSGLAWANVRDITPAYDFVRISTQNGATGRWSLKMAALARGRTKAELKSAMARALANTPQIASFMLWDEAALGPDLALHVTVEHTPSFVDRLIVDGGSLSSKDELHKLAVDRCGDPPLAFSGPLFKALIFYIEDSGCAGYLIDQHHAVADGFTYNLFLADLDASLANPNSNSLKSHVPYKVWCDSFFALRNSPAATAAVQYQLETAKRLSDVRDCIWPPLKMPLYDGPYTADGVHRVFSASGIQRLCSQSPNLTVAVVLKTAMAIFMMRKTGGNVALFGNLEAGRGPMPFVPPSLASLTNVEVGDIPGELLQVILQLVEFGHDERTLDLLQRQQQEQNLQTRHACAPWGEIIKSLDRESGELFPLVPTQCLFNWIGAVNPSTHAHKVLKDFCEVAGRYDSAFANDIELNSATNEIEVHMHSSKFTLEEVEQFVDEFEEAVAWLTDESHWDQPIRGSLAIGGGVRG